MKKFGLLIFAAALVVGMILSNMFSVGRIGAKFFSFPLHIGSVKGSGNTKTEDRPVSGFKGVDVGGVFQVEIVAQKEYSVQIEADDNLLPLIKTEVDDGVLKLSAERKLSSSNPIKIRISAPDISDLEVSGAANVTVADIKNSSLSVDSSGASKLKIAGETSKLTIDVSGATKIDADGLTADTANIDASGASSVTVNVTNGLHADASGASSVIYSGTPGDLVKSTSGHSSISPK